MSLSLVFEAESIETRAPLHRCKHVCFGHGYQRAPAHIAQPLRLLWVNRRNDVSSLGTLCADQLACVVSFVGTPHKPLLPSLFLRTTNAAVVPAPKQPELLGAHAAVPCAARATHTSPHTHTHTHTRRLAAAAGGPHVTRACGTHGSIADRRRRRPWHTFGQPPIGRVRRWCCAPTHSPPLPKLAPSPPPAAAASRQRVRICCARAWLHPCACACTCGRVQPNRQ
jgi:hypothetical protein